MKKLFILLLLSISSFVYSQPCAFPTMSRCADWGGTCAEYQVVNVFPYDYLGATQIYVQIAPLPTANFCSKEVDIYVNGIFIQHLGLMSQGGHVQYTASQGEQICVVARNVCTIPLSCFPTDFVDSQPFCSTPYAVATPSPSSAVSCKCVNNINKYIVSKPGNQNRCVSKSQCANLITKGWTSSCNCQ